MIDKVQETHLYKWLCEKNSEFLGQVNEAIRYAETMLPLFHEYVGITPKKLSNLIRYQFLWRDILWEPDFDVFNAVHKYGYTDQSHLLREFKRYHSMDIHEARTIALKDVENIQAVYY